MYRIEDLAHHSGATVRTIRGYQDRGLLPKPERRGRANVYGDSHLARLHQISGLLERGYTLASIRELLTAWDTGIGLGGVLGLVTEVDRPWSNEAPSVITRTELAAVFAVEDDRAVEENRAAQDDRATEEDRAEGGMDEEALAEAVELGVLVPVPEDPERYHVPSPQELAVAAELHAAGAPLGAVTGHLRELRGQIEHIASRFLDFTTEHVFARYLDHTPTGEEVAEATTLVRRLRPLAQQTVDAELARAMSVLATRHLQQQMAALSLPLPTNVSAADSAADSAHAATTPSAHTPETAPAAPGTVAAPMPRPEATAGRGATKGVGEGPGGVRALPLPSATVRAVSELVGEEPGGPAGRVAAFVTAATERELHARTMDHLTGTGRGTGTGAGAGAGTQRTPDP